MCQNLNRTIMLILYTEILQNTIQDFIDACNSLELQHYASDFCNEFDLENETIETAVKRAINACNSINIPYYSHFKHVFVVEDNNVLHDWKLSPFGCYLTILNTDPSNPLIAKFQESLIVGD